MVSYHEDETHRFNGGLNFGKGNVGLIYRTGYGGSTTGGYGSLYADPFDNLRLRFYANFQQYRIVEEISPLLESFVTSLTLEYEGLKPLALALEFQEAWNPVLDNDFRVFARANYRFRFSK